MGRWSLLWYGESMRPQPLIAVTDVEASSRWYQRLLDCRSAHGGAEYERLVSNGALILQLHRFEVEHHHGRIGDPNDKPYGNGVLIWFEIDDFDAAIDRAAEMKAEIFMPRHRNPPAGSGGPNQVVDRGSEEAAAPQRAGSCASEQARPHRLGGSPQRARLRVRQD